MASPKITRRKAFAVVGGAPILAALTPDPKHGAESIPTASGAPLHPRTAREAVVDVTPTNYLHPFGDLRRYGAIGGPSGSIPSVDDSAAWASAVKVGYIRIPQGMAFRIVTGADRIGQITILGEGPTSQAFCDGTILRVTDGTGSVADNFYMGNIMAPWIVTRSAPIHGQAGNAVFATLRRSSTALGYQPTANDVDTLTAPNSGTLWENLTAVQKDQNIGPVLQFQGKASGITVSRIRGQFVRVNIMDATNSSILDCDIRGGKGASGALMFDNATNAAQTGTGNRALRNRVQYASNSGVSMSNNTDFAMSDNECFQCGESGVKTSQNYGGIFTASVSGATSGLLQTKTTPGTWTFAFDNLETRVVEVAGDGVSCSWVGALNGGTVRTVNFWGGPAGVKIPFQQCFRGQINNNRCYYNKYDGVDASSSYPPNDSAQTFHQVNNNQCYGNGGTGMNLDGKFNICVGNEWSRNGIFGLWASGLSLSDVRVNKAIDNNQLRNSYYADILIAGTAAHNSIDGNSVYGGHMQNNHGIFASGTNHIRNNTGHNSQFHFGLPGAQTSVVENNTDQVSGLTTDQAFVFSLVNTNGVLRHSFCQDTGESLLGNFSSRIVGATATFTNTATGADSTTAFANGAKIASMRSNWIIFDTAPQSRAFTRLVVQIIANNTGTALSAQVFAHDVNVNGVAQSRIILQFTGQTDDNDFSLNPINLPAGKYIKVQVFGKIA